MKRKFYLIARLSRTAVLLACAAPLAAAAAPGVAPRLVTLRPTAEVPVSGRVTSADGVGLPGVTVLVRGTTIGTATNSDGTFSLNAPAGSTLTFSFVGYATQNAPVGENGNTSLTITLQEDLQKLNEVVVVGYGTLQRQDVTGAVSSISGKDVASQPVPDAA